MRVVVAEKPSVARDLARVLGVRGRQQGFFEGSGLRITWCHGHMAELQEPHHYDPEWHRWSLDGLPMLPEAFELALRDGARQQFAVIRGLLRDPKTEEVVNACDAGREGELIFRYVYELAGCRLPVQRLWVSSLTDQAIHDGWARLRPGTQFDRLADAARSRAEADWLVGLNATRALTCRARDGGGSGLLSVGRVQTPTLAMIVARDREIEAFVPQDFWQVKATLQADVPSEPRSWEATFFRPDLAKGEKDDDSDRPDKEPAAAERLSDEPSAQAVAAAAEGRVGVVETADRRRTRERPPLLYDLTSLQRRANQRYGLSAQRTLDLAQALYEKHKVITYPRTDARHLTPDQVPGLPDVLRGLLPIPVYAPFAQALLAAPLNPGKRVVDAAEVGDHHAIIPTGRTPSASGLNPDEKRVFDLVARRFLAALSDDALFDVTKLVVAVDPGDAPLPEGVTAPLRFRARGRICRQQGWRAVDPPGRSKDVELPAVDVDDRVDVDSVRVNRGQTRPPRAYTDGTLLHAMETAGKVLDDNALMRALRGKGLGTPATRAAILQTLLTRKYVERHGKELHATEQGRALIDAVPVDALKSAELTGEWEGRLSDLAEGRPPGRPAFMREVVAWVHDVVQAVKAAPAPHVVVGELPPPLGACPRCGQPVRQRGPVWTCDTGRACPFVVFATMSKRKISQRLVKQLLVEGRTPPVKGFKSKAGKEFSAGLVWDAERERVGFWFADDEKPTRRPIAEGDRCPTCGQGTVIRGRKALGCSRWRDGCSFRT